MLVRSYRAVARVRTARLPRTKTEQLVQLSAILSRAGRSNASTATYPPALAFTNVISELIQGHRTYATDAAKVKTTRSKKTTDSTAAKAKTPTKAATKKANTTRKKGATKSSKAKKSKPVAKKKKKPVRRPAKKTKAKTVKKRPKKKLTDAEKANIRLRELRAVALLNQEPKKLPATAYLVVNTEVCKGKTSIAGAEAGRTYKSLTPEQMEHYNQVANKNKEINQANFKKWVESHTVDQIRLANNARKQLRTRFPKRVARARLHLIPDGRIPKPAVTAYPRFLADRLHSGDFKHLKLAEAAKLIGSEWKALGSSQKQEYQRQFLADRARYEAEFKTVFNRSVSPRRVPKTKTTTTAAV